MFGIWFSVCLMSLKGTISLLTDDPQYASHTFNEAFQQIQQLKMEVESLRNQSQQQQQKMEFESSKKQSQIQHLEIELENIRNQTKSIPQGMVAFYAQLSNPKTGLGHDQTIIFDYVITNIGNRYNPATGIFQCDEPGLYLFSCTVVVDHGHYLELELVKNNAAQGYIFAHNDVSWGSSTNNIIIELTTGDAVWVKTHAGYFHSDVEVDDDFTNFLGYRIG